jgi:cyclase
MAIQTTFLVSAALASATLVFAQAPPAGGRGAAQPATQTISMIKPDLYIVTGAGGNSTVRVTKAGVILVDSKNLGDQFYNGLVEQIKTVTKESVKDVIITHVHQDHSGNTAKFIEAGAQVIANEGEKAEVATYSSPAGKPAPPSMTYTDKTVVKLGGKQARVFHFGKGHTGGDSIVYFPDLKVVSGGDVIVGVQPNCDYPNGGSLVEWRNVLAQVAKLNFDTVVPGHSAPNTTTMTRADFMTYKGKVDMLVSRAAELVKSGTPKDQLLAKIKTDDLGWNVNTPQWSAPARLDPMYAELSKLK